MNNQYVVMPNAAQHTCWDKLGWDGGLVQDDCMGCKQAAEHPCQWCGYGEAFTIHNDEAHSENGDMNVPEEPTEEWYNSPHLATNPGKQNEN